MKKPAVVAPMDEVTRVGQVFSTPLVVKGKTWFPLVQLFAWPVMAWVAKRRVPGRSWLESMVVGALTMPVVLGSEWGHNLAHAVAAHLVGKPMDAIRITWGMPLCVYYDIGDRNVSPRQHIARALGGPVFNLLVLLGAVCFRRRTDQGSIARDIADAAVRVNAFLPVVGLLPIPGIDGGPVLKWSLVEGGRTPQEADRVVRKVDGVLGVLLGTAGVDALKNRRWLWSGLLLSLAAAALGVAMGLLEER
jgi:Zn-dependent protease